MFRRRPDTTPIVAGMATMPSRAATLSLALRSILSQVDRLYLYLDGHSDTPQAAQGEPRIRCILSRDAPGLHGNGKFLALSFEPDPFRFIGVDDDIAYPANYAAALCEALRTYRGRAVVGYHGVILGRPLVQYHKGRTVFHFAEGLRSQRVVDVLGTGTVMFSSSVLNFDVNTWQHVNMLDVHLALEAARKKLPLVCLPRDQGFLRVLAGVQPDSNYSALLRDDSIQTALARQLPLRNKPLRNAISKLAKLGWA
jgi:hypothetical protein